jgi:hypothetical protein
LFDKQASQEAVRKLAYLVLPDVGLTQKILRMSNAVVHGKPLGFSMPIACCRRWKACRRTRRR